MATGLKYQEITGKLVVSVTTDRHYTRNINGILDVNSRALIQKKRQNILAFFFGNWHIPRFPKEYFFPIFLVIV